jgi:hypothetical protein
MGTIKVKLVGVFWHGNHKGEVGPATHHEGSEQEQIYIALIFL